MFTLGHNFSPANIHAEVCVIMAPAPSSAIDERRIDERRGYQAIGYLQGRYFIRASGRNHTGPGIIPRYRRAIHRHEQAKIEGKPRTILFNLSGHGLIDMAAYDQYLSGDLTNYEVTDEK